jgi:hypothetical protein
MNTEQRSICVNFKTTGTLLNKNTKTRIWWAKLAVAIILSNIFFFVLFSKNENDGKTSSIPSGWVEIQVRAELLTSFQSRKKVLLLHREGRRKIEAMLETSPIEPEGRFTVLVRESEAEALLKYESWEIIPFLKTISFFPQKNGVTHEIRY